jgi:hypothetical protein
MTRSAVTRGPPRYVLHPLGGEDRAIVLRNLQAFLSRLPDTKGYVVEIRPLKKTRTPKQRKSLFGVAYATIMEQTGLEGSKEKDRLHTHFCGEFFGWKTGVLGLSIPIRTTTTNERGEDEEIDTDTANRMYAFIQRSMAEYDVDVPDPDPLYNEVDRV